MINKTRNFRKILMILGEEDLSTPNWDLQDEMEVYNESILAGFSPSVSGAVRYIPKDARMAGI